MDFNEQNNELLEQIVSPFFNFWTKTYDEQIAFFKDNTAIMEPFLELFITGGCNQKCEYCYLQKHQHELYPSEIDKPELILHNINLFFAYLHERNVKCIPRLDLFSGEIWGWPLGNKVFDAIYENITKYNIHVPLVLIPSNCSFIINENTREVVDYYISKFSTIGTRLVFSISYDGPVIDEKTRPFKNAKLASYKGTETYFNALVDWAAARGYGWHPMIDAGTIEYQKENYKHWIEITKKNFPNDIHRGYCSIMQLEVRSEQWTDDKIKIYLDWLNFLMETDIEVFFDGDKEKFKSLMFYGDPDVRAEYPGHEGTYLPYQIGSAGAHLGCALGQMLCVRLGDLSLQPCHRQSYPKLTFGKFVVNDDNTAITHLQANNVILANAYYYPSWTCQPKCGVCPIRATCIKSCLGLNYEQNHDSMLPVEENCNLQKAKFIFLFQKYKKLYSEKDIPQNWKQAYYHLQSVEKEFVEKWNIISLSLI